MTTMREWQTNRAVRHALEFAPWLVAGAALATWTTLSVLAQTGGEPSAPLDDAYIHFQYARSFAEGRPFQYTAGAPPTPGATSILWPLVLAPFMALGIDGSAIVWVAWAIGWTSLAGLAYETRALCRGLGPEPIPIAAGALVLVFGASAWFAGSGMEVMPFGYLLTRTARRSSEWLEEPAQRSNCLATELGVIALLGPLMRPEGIVGSLLVAGAFAWAPPGGRRRWAALPVAALAGPSFVYAAVTGSALSTTAAAKWLVMNPYFEGRALLEAVHYNVRLFFVTLLDGELWTSLFIPSGGRIIAWLALPAVAWAGLRTGRTARAACVIAIGLGALIPATYETFLVNRVRYLWPFSAAWLIGLALVADAVADGLARFGAPRRWISALLAGGCAGIFASRLGVSVGDLSTSAAAVQAQQVALARWVRDHLPERALVGVNDTGAIAYFGRRPTFDIVGLTTRGEARYWTAGAGSRFEHYEHLPDHARPDFFVVYPEWFAIPSLLGEELTRRTVRHTILGGATMGVYRARYEVLGSAERPLSRELVTRPVVEALDVADLESEAQHDYALLDASQAENVVVQEGRWADGARHRRRRDRFRMRLAPGKTLSARLGSPAEQPVAVFVDGTRIGHFSVEPVPWQECTLRLPSGLPDAVHDLEVVAAEGQSFVSMHYWLLD